MEKDKERIQRIRETVKKIEQNEKEEERKKEEERQKIMQKQKEQLSKKIIDYFTALIEEEANDGKIVSSFLIKKCWDYKDEETEKKYHNAAYRRGRIAIIKAVSEEDRKATFEIHISYKNRKDFESFFVNSSEFGVQNPDDIFRILWMDAINYSNRKKSEILEEFLKVTPSDHDGEVIIEIEPIYN